MKTEGGIVLPAAFAAAAAALYFAAMDSALDPGLLIVLKGAAVGILALAAARAARAARSRDGWLLAMVMAFGAAGDMLLEVEFIAGAAAFAAGHVAAIALYLFNRRPAPMPFSQKAAAAALLLAAVPVHLLAGDARDAGTALYAALLCGMAAAAWTSRFSRYRTGIGAVLFLASDALIFAQLAGNMGAEVLIWPLYAAGQILIFVGVAPKLLPGTGRGTA